MDNREKNTQNRFYEGKRTASGTARRPSGFSAPRRSEEAPKPQYTPEPRAKDEKRNVRRTKNASHRSKNRRTERRGKRRIGCALIVLAIALIAALIVGLIVHSGAKTVHMLPEIRDIATETTADFAAQGAYGDANAAQDSFIAEGNGT